MRNKRKYGKGIKKMYPEYILKQKDEGQVRHSIVSEFTEQGI